MFKMIEYESREEAGTSGSYDADFQGSAVIITIVECL